MTIVEVRLWGARIGATTVDGPGRIASFEYDPDFSQSGIEVAPLQMPLAAGRVYRFPGLSIESFHGLPGLLADSTPDRFGRRLINEWLVRNGRDPSRFDSLELLSYLGQRGMGALEFSPATGPRASSSERVHLDSLVALASDVLANRDALSTSLADGERERAMAQILRIGTSAGGARAKAVIAWNPETNDVRTGQLDAPPGYSHWLLKFDGVSGSRDKELADPAGYTIIEYAYSEMARSAGIAMPETRLLEEGGRRHFMVRRFDRPEDGGKVHMQSLGAMAHLDFNQPLANSYEQAFQVMRELGMSGRSREEQFRRMVFNIVARNQDDHVKNIAYVMDRSGEWSLSPAFDVTYAYNPDGRWTGQHQMSVNGRRDGFTMADLDAIARFAGLKARRSTAIFTEVAEAVTLWREFAGRAGVFPEHIDAIADAHRLALPRA